MIEILKTLVCGPPILQGAPIPLCTSFVFGSNFEKKKKKKKKKEKDLINDLVFLATISVNIKIEKYIISFIFLYFYKFQL